MGLLAGRRVVVALTVLAAVGLLAGYGMATRARPRSTSVELDSPEPSDRRSGRTLHVHVGGEVQRPGLYRLRDGSRVDDALTAAGGPTDLADLDAINLAAKVKDGDKVLVPSTVPAAPSGPGAPPAPPDGGPGGASGGSLINLNAATPADLETLPGIGPALAERIVAYRTEHGGFRRVEDLLEVPGIGPKKFEELKAHVTV